MKHFDASIAPGGPHYSPDIFGPDGRLKRFCGGGGGGDGGAAAAATSAEASKKQSDASLAAMRKQNRIAADATSPSFTPASAPAFATPDTLSAAMDQRRRSLARFGFAKTAVSQNTLGQSAVLGGAA